MINVIIHVITKVVINVIIKDINVIIHVIKNVILKVISSKWSLWFYYYDRPKSLQIPKLVTQTYKSKTNTKIRKYLLKENETKMARRARKWYS